MSDSLDRGSYTSFHALLNLLIKLRKRDQMRGSPSILSLFHNEFNKSNNTGARMFDSVYRITLKLLNIRIFGVKASKFCHVLRNFIMEVIILRY